MAVEVPVIWETYLESNSIDLFGRSPRGLPLETPTSPRKRMETPTNVSPSGLGPSYVNLWRLTDKPATHAFPSADAGEAQTPNPKRDGIDLDIQGG